MLTVERLGLHRFLVYCRDCGTRYSLEESRVRAEGFTSNYGQCAICK